MLEKVASLDDLKISIQSINVKDYGDFKRKSILYINRFLENKPVSSSVQNIFTEMIHKIQYSPNLDIETTRFWTLQKIKSLKDVR